MTVWAVAVVVVVALAVIGIMLMDGTLFKSLLVLAAAEDADRISSGGEDDEDDDDVDEVDEEVGLLRNAATLKLYFFNYFQKFLFLLLFFINFSLKNFSKH